MTKCEASCAHLSHEWSLLVIIDGMKSIRLVFVVVFYVALIITFVISLSCQ